MKAEAVTDAELNSRLDEVAGFTPFDKWDNIRRQLRNGKTYFVSRTGGKLKIKVMDQGKRQHAMAKRGGAQ